MNALNRFERAALNERFLQMARRHGVTWAASVMRPLRSPTGAKAKSVGDISDVALLDILGRFSQGPGETMRLLPHGLGGEAA